MFHIRQRTDFEIRRHLAAGSGYSVDCPHLLTMENGIEPGVLSKFSLDRSQSYLGHGEAVFAAAKRAFASWKMFDLGWVHVVNSTATIASGQLVAVEVYSLGLWTVNLSRIVETVDNEAQYGFVYATTTHHVEQDEERFLLRFDPATGEITYDLEAISRPCHVLAKIGYPVTRHFQRRFARDSHRRMQQAVTLKV